MTNENVPIKPKRRPRYKGTHPRKFSEKYKELNPENFGEDVEKIKARGATPAGTHRPICVEEIMQILDPQPGEIALDATLGFGGHSSFLWPRLMPNGILIGVDQDPIERPKTEHRLRAQGISENSLVIAPINFRKIRQFLNQRKIEKVDLILADLGVSSMQIDDPSRGFSFKIEGPLDLRMNPQIGRSAAELLKNISAAELSELLIQNADEPFANMIANALVNTPPETTLQLAVQIRKALAQLSKKRQLEVGDSSIRRTFQALRIAVNQEFSALDQFLLDIPNILSVRGRVAILSFHSGEDRRVKKSFQVFKRSGVYREISPEFIRPTLEEQKNNPRSKSAKLRWAKI